MGFRAAEGRETRALLRSQNLVRCRQKQCRRDLLRKNTALTEIPVSSRSFRVDCVFFSVFGFCLLLAFRLYNLQSIENQHWQQLASRQQQTSVEVQRARNSVTDTSGKPLAVSVPRVSVVAYKNRIIEQESLLKLASVVDEEPAVLAEQLEESGFVWLKRNLPFRTAEQVKKLRMQGIGVVEEFGRFYPQGGLAGAVLGRVSRDGHGQSGIELAFETLLSKNPLQLNVRRDARGRLAATDSLSEAALRRVDWSGVDSPFSPYIGNTSVLPKGSLQLSLDASVQSLVEEELQQGMLDAEAKRAFGLVMDVDSGEILAMAQVPSFDPNTSSGVQPEDLKNILIQSSFEPGSTIKPLVAAIGLSRNVVSLKEKLDCENGTYRVSKHVISDVHPLGVASLESVLIESSNIGMAKVGQRLGADKLHSGLRMFGFGSKSGIELIGEARGILRKPYSWREIDVSTHAFGHGIAVTPLQLIRAYAVIANGGYLVTPTIIKGRQGRAERVLNEDLAKQIERVLQRVTSDGTGRRAAINGIAVAGKTGTAHKTLQAGRGYDKERVLASYIGFVDGRQLGVERRLSMLVMIDEPAVEPRWGGAVAAPVFSRAMERILSNLMTGESQMLQTAQLMLSDVDV